MDLFGLTVIESFRKILSSLSINESLRAKPLCACASHGTQRLGYFISRSNTHDEEECLQAGLDLQDLLNIIINQMALFAVQPSSLIIDQLATTVTSSPYPEFLIIHVNYISRIIIIK